MGMTNDGWSYWQAETGGIELFEMTIGDLLDRRADELPLQEAIVYSCQPEFEGSHELRWTYQQYRERANQVAHGLMALGLSKGDHIAVWGTNLPEWALLEMATAKAGLVLVTVNPAYRVHELEYVLKQGDVRVLFLMAQVRDQDCLATVRSLVTPGAHNGEVSSERLPLLRSVCLLGAAPQRMLEQEGWRPLLFEETVAAGTEISDDELRARQAQVRPQDPAQIQYTSGTTGFPKGAILPHRSILNNAMIVARQWGLGQGDRYCNPMPFFHTAGCVIGMLGPLAAGAVMHPLLTFHPLTALHVISRERCTTLLAVPTMLLAMLQHPDFETYDLTSLVRVGTGGATVPVSLIEQVTERMGANVCNFYGQTEASPFITKTLPDDPFELKATTVGLPLPHSEVKLIDPAGGNIVACGEHGEFCCRGYQVMIGYYKMEEATRAAIDSEGWLHTGDLATMNAQGYLNIVGRLKEMVIRGGENIFPREIEEFLLRHPRIAEVYVVGVPDAFFGEELLAVVRLREGEKVTEQELREFCKGKISHQKIPRYFQFVDSYPMTASGKVQKFVLREQAIKALGLQEIAPVKGS
jgi:fatty-acyl-CoA synthase